MEFIVRTTLNYSYKGSMFYKDDAGVFVSLSNKASIKVYIPFKEINEIIIDGNIISEDFSTLLVG